MAIGYNTSIVTNGLKLYLDAGNPKSYTFNENILTYSTTLSTNWVINGTATRTQNAGIAPDNTNTAISFSASLGGSGVYTIFGLTGGLTYTYSIYVKYLSGDANIFFGCDTGNLALVNINTQTGVVSSRTGSPSNIVSRSVGNGWYRVSFSLVPPSNANYAIIMYTNSASATSWLAWGAQVEKSPTVNKYVPTTASASTASTTWTDLSGNGFNATLFNSPTFTSANNGCFIFDGVDDYASFTNPLNQTQLNQEWTVQSWINVTTKPPQTLIAGLNDGLFIEYVQGNNSLLYLNQGANDYYTYGGQFTAQGWVLATFRFNNSNGNREIWRNRTNISTSGPNFTNTPSGQSGTFTLGVNGSSTILGRVSTLFMYNRYLTDTEVEQNFGALRGRYSV